MENCIHFWAERFLKYAIFRKKDQIKVFWHRISDKKVRKAYVYLPPGVELGGLKDNIAEILNCTEMENCILFWAECCRKYVLFQKKVQIKVFRHRILYATVRKGICLSPPVVELGGSKDGYS